MVGHRVQSVSQSKQGRGAFIDSYMTEETGIPVNGAAMLVFLVSCW